MQMSQIRYVLSAAEHLNFTVAAETCNVSQPALTKGIKKLEHSLGAPIFHREGKRILVSDFGNTMMPHLRQIMQEAETAQELAQNFRLLNQAPLKLGVMSTIGHLRLARFLARFEKSFSGIELSVQETSPDTLRRDLADGKIDVAVMTQMDDMTNEQFRIMPLYQERYVVVIPPRSPPWRAEPDRAQGSIGRTLCRPTGLRTARDGHGRLRKPRRRTLCQVPVGTRRLGPGDGSGRVRLCLHARVFRHPARPDSAAAGRPGSQPPDLAFYHTGAPAHSGIVCHDARSPCV